MLSLADQAALAARIDAVLPQTQCTRCGYPDCAGYARAIVSGDAGINQCPPGGEEGVARLAALTGQSRQPLSPEHGAEGPRRVVFIDEDWCIGCTLCVKACPTDAIMGSNKTMHTVIEAHCTGCELCIPVCPVDCILLENASGAATGWNAWSSAQADAARARYTVHNQRARALAQEADASPALLAIDTSSDALAANAPASAATDPKRAAIAAAMARAKALRAPRTPPDPAG